MSDISFNFNGKNFAVVGASSGIGRQITLDLAKANANVLAVARNEERLNELKNEFPDKITTARVDVVTADNKIWEDAILPFAKKHGKLNGAAYTAGIGDVASLNSYDEETSRRVMDTNFWGMIRFLHVATKKKFAQKNSSYVAFASTAAHTGNRGQFAYTASKGAVQAVVRTIAKEICRDGSRINSVSPAIVKTPMTQVYGDAWNEITPQNIYENHLLGIGEPAYVSSMVLFLLSDASVWITGTDILIDGGYVLGKH